MGRWLSWVQWDYTVDAELHGGKRQITVYWLGWWVAFFVIKIQWLAEMAASHLDEEWHKGWNVAGED